MLKMTDWDRLGRLINDLHTLTGVKFALLDENAHEIYTSSFRTPFCQLIAEAGDKRCQECDARALRDARKSRSACRYLCHAGLYEVALPVLDNGRPVAAIVFGQMLDDAPREEQWRRVREQCAWYPDPDALYAAFLRLKRLSASQINACAEIVTACISEVRYYGLSAGMQRDDAALLEEYIDAHFMERVTLDTLCRALSMGKTRLCGLCTQRFGMPPMRLLNRRRMDAAMEMLSTTDRNVRFVAQAVGIPDENYFIKVFKKTTGLTPTAYRRQRAAQQR